MSFIGEVGVSRLDPEGLFNLSQAKEMLEKEISPVTIKSRTGWEKGVDDKWRYKIEDPFLDTDAIEDYVKPRYGEPINIRMIVKDQTILEAYPEFEDLTLYVMYSPRKGTAGYYNPSTNGMVLSMGNKTDGFEFQIEGVLLHEVQHLIQQIEGFAKGGDPKTVGRRRYHRLAGEVEARNVCARHSLTQDERRLSLRTLTQDVPDQDQIISYS